MIKLKNGMAHNNQQHLKIDFRSAEPSDARLASRLLFDTFPKMATYVFGLGDAQRAKQILADSFAMEGHRFSYEYTQIGCQGNAEVGILISYPGRKLNKLEWGLAKAIHKNYSFWEKFRLIQRSLPMLFIQEAAFDEYLLSNLAVKKSRRSQGIGEQMLSHAEEKAIQAGYHKLALMVEIDNQDARRFYERHGFSIKAIHLEPNQRVKHLGPGYQRMVKVLEK